LRIIVNNLTPHQFDVALNTVSNVFISDEQYFLNEIKKKSINGSETGINYFVYLPLVSYSSVSKEPVITFTNHSGKFRLTLSNFDSSNLCPEPLLLGGIIREWTEDTIFGALERKDTILVDGPYSIESHFSEGSYIVNINLKKD
jgi:hypothetical protein